MSFLDRVRSIGEEQRTAANEGGASVTPTVQQRTPMADGPGDPEIQAMNAEAPLLDLIRADTGEEGHASADRIDFESCPVCGHRHCFTYYPSTNSWACFGESNASGYKGGSFVEYQRAAHGMNVTEAVKALREATGHPYVSSDTWYDFDGNIVPKSDAGKESDAQDDGKGDPPKLLLPPWEHVRAVDPPKRAPVLIEGILRRGHVALLAGKGKAGKSWSAIELSVAVATHGSWFGHSCARGRVLYVDPELDRRSLDNRFRLVASKMGANVEEVDANVTAWSLRGVMKANGKPPTVADIAHDIEARCSSGDFALVILDSCSAFLEGDENASADVRRFFAHVLRIPKATGASVLCLHHYGKSSAGDRSPIDRSRGSSAWGDCPDAPLSLTEIFPPEGQLADYLDAGERAFVLEDSGLREFPGMQPLHLVFSYPVHRVDVKGITASWKPLSSQKKAARASGESRQSKAEARASKAIIALAGVFIRDCIGAEGMTATEAAEAVSEAIGETVRTSTLKKYVDASDCFDVWQRSERRWLVVPRHPPTKQPEAPRLDL